ncbi:oxygen-dependent choline dehydrogenase-like [Convolutriloba macropyga]|uniref:oxygen-dependent choline dehydrogenase-like n=1 Tax=Convolutriloba macropyga TaxID=536237 RepID=UPI003F52870E
MPFVDSAEECYDYIIVGAGASGCVVANRLSRTNKTLLIEAGGLDSSWEVLMPQHCGLTWGDERFSWPIMSTPQVHLKNSKSTTAYLGKVIGGSASINTMCWMRGNQSDYDSWASLGERSNSAPILVPVACVNKSDNYYYGMYPNNKKEMAQRDWFVNHTGPHTSLGLDVAAIIKTDKKLDRPNANFMFVDSLYGPFPGGNLFQRDHSETPGYMCAVSNAQVFSRGSVTLQSSDFKDEPLVDYDMFSDNRDVQNAIEGVKVVRQIFEHEALSDDVQTVVLPPPHVRSEQELEGFVREMVGSHGYYSGTCKMGSYSDSMAVTDNQGRVWGVGNLRVVDSSIIPDAPSGPLVSVCTMMAEKICDKIQEPQQQF